MSNVSYKVRFEDGSHAPVELPPHAQLSEYLDVQNSPVLFGCRTGICGTCVIKVSGSLAPPSRDEQETLELVAPDEPCARLACQLDLTCDIDITIP